MSEDGWWTIGGMLAELILGLIVGYFIGLNKGATKIFAGDSKGLR